MKQITQLTAVGNDLYALDSNGEVLVLDNVAAFVLTVFLIATADDNHIAEQDCWTDKEDERSEIDSWPNIEIEEEKE